MMNILFVCTGNVSRSYLAEMLLKHEVKQLNLENVSVSSAGVSVFPGSPADARMVAFLLEKGIPAEDHSSRQITRADVDWADRILVMAKAHKAMIEEQWPEGGTKTELVGKYISPDQAEDDVIDPFGGSSYHYRVAQSQISLAIKSLIRTIAI